MEKRLMRSGRDRMISGVAGGLAEYFEIDSTIIRLIITAITVAQPVFLIVYVAGAVIMPEKKQYGGEPETAEAEANSEDAHRLSMENTRLIIGGALLFIGLTILSKSFIPWHVKFFWPAVLIITGALLMYRGWKK